MIDRVLRRLVDPADIPALVSHFCGTVRQNHLGPNVPH